MATYFQSLTATSVSETSTHIATVSGTYTTVGGGTTPDQPYNFIIEEVNSSGQVIASDPNLVASSVSGGQFAVSYDASKFAIPAGYSLEVGTSDTQNGSTISTQPYQAVSAIDGYLAGAKIFVDSNSNGVLDTGEYSTTTDSSGNAFLPAGSGQIVAVGGTDTTTGLAFSGTLTAPSTATVVTPITTLVSQGRQAQRWGCRCRASCRGQRSWALAEPQSRQSRSARIDVFRDFRSFCRSCGQCRACEHGDARLGCRSQWKLLRLSRRPDRERRR